VQAEDLDHESMGMTPCHPASAPAAVAEFGDLTQIVTANLAAKYHDPLTAGVASVLALWAVAGLAIVGGCSLLRVVPITLITRIAAVVMVVLAALSLYEAFK
jgi:putative Ca2+/H+ antiporter (TMEM165/GDT1 family)